MGTPTLAGLAAIIQSLSGTARPGGKPDRAPSPTSQLDELSRLRGGQDLQTYRRSKHERERSVSKCHCHAAWPRLAVMDI